MRRHIRARRVGDRAEVAEGKARAEAARVLGVERGPAAVAGLHAQRPRDATLDGRVDTGHHRVTDQPQREHDLGRVVDVGVVVVRELERPAAGREQRTPHGPVALDPDLLAQQPLGGALDGRIVRGGAGVTQRDHGQAGVPDR